MTNPLLSNWNTAFGIAPFDKISDKDFSSALNQALAADMAETCAIAEQKEAPTFENTIHAILAKGRDLDKVLSVFYTVSGADSNPAREALMREFSPKLSAHTSEIIANEALFHRIDSLWKKRHELGLNAEEARVLMLTHRNFVRSGAALKGAEKERMKDIKSRLSILGTDFSQNLLADERDWFMPLAEADMEGLPDFLISAAKAAAMHHSGRCSG